MGPLGLRPLLRPLLVKLWKKIMITGALCGIDHGLTMSFRPLTSSANMTYLFVKKDKLDLFNSKTIISAAKKQKGKSGSLDGWGGTEVALWPVSMWTSLCMASQHMDTFPAVGHLKASPHPQRQAGHSPRWGQVCFYTQTYFGTFCFLANLDFCENEVAWTPDLVRLGPVS